MSAIAYPVVIEPRWFELTKTRIKIAGGHTVRLLHLSDMHRSWAVPLSSIEAAIRAAIAQQPDLIMLTGDFITHRYDFDQASYTKALRQLTLTARTFAVLGNHDGGRWAKDRRGYSDHSVVERLLEDAAITLLHNRSEAIEVRGRKILLVGVGDLWADELDARHAFAGAQANTPTILLSHNPDSKDMVRSFRWDLMLCGHTHGGQIIIPFEGPRYAPVSDKRFVAGLHEWDGRQIYISRGVGNLGGVRFMCRPEVSVLDVAVG